MLEAAFYFVLTIVAKSFTIKGKVSVNIVLSLSIYSRYILFKEGQTLSLCHIFKIQCFAETFTIHVALCFDLILFTTQGASRIFLNIIETVLASHLIVYRLYFFPLYRRSKKTHNMVLSFYLDVWIILTTVLTAHETSICTFLPKS